MGRVIDSFTASCIQPTIYTLQSCNALTVISFDQSKISIVERSLEDQCIV